MIKPKEIIALKPESTKKKDLNRLKVDDLKISKGPNSDRKYKMDYSLDVEKKIDQSPDNLPENITKIVENTTCMENSPMNKELMSLDFNKKSENISLNKKKEPSYIESTNVSNKNQTIPANSLTSQNPVRRGSYSKNNERLLPVGQISNYDFNKSKTKTNNNETGLNPSHKPPTGNSYLKSSNIEPVQVNVSSVDKYDKARNQIKKLVNRNSGQRTSTKTKNSGINSELNDESQIKALNYS